MLSRTARRLAPLAAHQPVRQPPIIRTRLQPQRTRARFSTSSPLNRETPKPSDEEKSLNGQFYKTFGRPIAKVFLLAIFTYQVAYYFWVRLEYDEIKSEMRGMRLYIPSCERLQGLTDNRSDYCRSRGQDRATRESAEMIDDYSAP
ncbi:hypothetical protein F4677DRAFT_416268 [Hypoxylon crocopeplum]|nr:hypothetical protein F4677DRAFT_416268 [Hypoxylon crocopeplum]